VTGLLIPARFNGPPGSGNGGFTAGRIASFFDFDAVVQVTLRQPPPLEVELSFSDGELRHGERLVAQAHQVDAHALGDPVPAVDLDTAAAAMNRFDGLDRHPFPTCFVCGTARPEHDGLELFAGATAPGAAAAVFEPRTDLVQSYVGTGLGDSIGPEMLWCALDCPGGWATGLPGRPAVLGRMTARVTSLPMVGERCVIVGQLDAEAGRKLLTRTTAYGQDGRELGRAAATWIVVAPATG
jgi:hypothetical protein